MSAEGQWFERLAVLIDFSTARTFLRIDDLPGDSDSNSQLLSCDVGLQAELWAGRGGGREGERPGGQEGDMRERLLWAKLQTHLSQAPGSGGRAGQWA